MKRLQSSGFAKFLAALLLIGCLFAGSALGMLGLAYFPFWQAESYQDTPRFTYIVQEYQNTIVRGVANYLALERDEGLAYTERMVLQENLEAAKENLSRDNTNFRFQLKTADGSQVLYSNLGEGEDLAALVETVCYATFTAGNTYVDDYRDYWYASSAENAAPNASIGAQETQGTLLVMEYGVPSIGELNEEAGDAFCELSVAWYQAHIHTEDYLGTACMMGGVALLALLYLFWSAGHRSGVEGICVTWQERIFLEVYFFVFLCLGVGVCACLMEAENFFHTFYWTDFHDAAALDLMTWSGAAVITAGILIVALLLRTVLVRLKAGMLIRSCLIFRVCAWVWRRLVEIVQAMPFLWKTVAAFTGYFFFNILLTGRMRHDSFAGFLWFMLNAAVFLLLCWWAIGFRRLREGSQALAGGNLDHQIDTQRMLPDLKAAAEDMNNISIGMSRAVSERMKSERFKAELITNVSHDLKTPLTSIINYVDLLKTTEQPDPEAQEYIDVLDRKSQRLKKLTEDLVEASKASTGVLNINREKISLSQLLDQALGEWSEKLEARALSVITSIPEGEISVFADGRHLWRVLDNLLANCSKYAMEGTRIYFDLVRGKGQVVLSVKNISREPLNIPPEQLMERFVRGEESRSTEGSGLGLSIARSLTELQGGTFELAVDGDLFKAIVTLPQAN